MKLFAQLDDLLELLKSRLVGFAFVKTDLTFDVVARHAMPIIEKWISFAKLYLE